MSDEEIRIAVAEVLGEAVPKHNWDERDEGRYDECTRCGETWRFQIGVGGNPPNGPCHGTRKDYPNDLNACAEMRRSVEYPEQYAGILGTILLRDRSASNFDGTTKWYFSFADANARQHCETFLRIRGKWKEGA